jgi:recombination protein RecR
MSLNDRFLPEAIVNLIDDLNKLPTIGRKSAQRLAFHLLRQDPADINKLSQSISGIVENIKFCKQCFNLCDDNLCKVCRNNNRNQNLICVVEEVLDLIAIENTNEFSGSYHVLHGSLSPLDGVGPNELKLKELKARIEQAEESVEIILATSTSSEGEATAVYISEMFKENKNVRISRIASGLPVGGNLDYADELTLKRAMAGRVGY